MAIIKDTLLRVYIWGSLKTVKPMTFLINQSMLDNMLATW